MGDPPTGDGQSGHFLQVNPFWTQCLNASQKKYVIAHELGHTIGFRHTNWRTADPPSNLGANLIFGTPETDTASVMNANTGGKPWNGFSLFDKLAGFELYPPPNPNVDAPTYPGGVPTFSWSALPDGPKFRIILSDYYSFWYDPAQDYESSTSDFAGSWTYGLSATYTGQSYTGVSECHVGSREPGAYDRVDTWMLQVQYPIADQTGYGAYYVLLGPAEILTC